MGFGENREDVGVSWDEFAGERSRNADRERENQKTRMVRNDDGSTRYDDVHDHSLIVEVVGIRDDDITIRVFALFDVESPKDGREMEEEGVVGDVHTKALATTIAKSGVSLGGFEWAER